VRSKPGRSYLTSVFLSLFLSRPFSTSLTLARPRFRLVSAHSIRGGRPREVNGCGTSGSPDTAVAFVETFSPAPLTPEPTPEPGVPAPTPDPGPQRRELFEDALVAATGNVTGTVALWSLNSPLFGAGAGVAVAGTLAGLAPNSDGCG